MSSLIQKYSARVLEERQRSAVQAQRERQFNALTHSSVGHPFTVLVSVVCAYFHLLVNVLNVFFTCLL